MNFKDLSFTLIVLESCNYIFFYHMQRKQKGCGEVDLWFTV